MRNKIEKTTKPLLNFSMQKSLLHITFYLLLTGILLLSTFYFLPTSVQAAVVYVLPSSQEISEGSTFVAEIRLDTEGAIVENVELFGTFSSENIEILDIVSGGSILSSSEENVLILNEQGLVTFAGEIPDGFEGDGLIGRIIFLAGKKGNANLSFLSESEVSSTDSTEELLILEGNYEIGEQPEGILSVSSASHPEQEKWYRGTTLRIHWDFTNTSEYSYILNKDPQTKADEIADRPEGELEWIGDMEYAWLDSAIYYFHVRECAQSSDSVESSAESCVWGPTATFRVMLDATSPEDFEPEILEIDGKQHVAFAGSDMLSGLHHYEVTEIRQKRLFGIVQKKTPEEENWKVAESPFVLEDQNLDSIVKVKAVDRAGNAKLAEIVPSSKIRIQDVWPVFLVIFLVIGAVMGWMWKKSKIQNSRLPKPGSGGQPDDKPKV